MVWSVSVASLDRPVGRHGTGCKGEETEDHASTFSMSSLAVRNKLFELRIFHKRIFTSSTVPDKL